MSHIKRLRRPHYTLIAVLVFVGLYSVYAYQYDRPPLISVSRVATLEVGDSLPKGLSGKTASGKRVWYAGFTDNDPTRLRFVDGTNTVVQTVRTGDTLTGERFAKNSDARVTNIDTKTGTIEIKY